MAVDLGMDFISLYDLVMPSIAQPSYSAPPPAYQQATTDVGAFWGSPVQPSRMDSFTDRLVGSDRYQELPDEARQRALSQAIMSLGQSLSQAGMAPDYRHMGAALAGAIPQAYGAFEGGLQREQQQFQQREDREYAMEQRAYQKGQQERVTKEQGFEDVARQARNEAMPAAIQDARSFMDGIQVDQYDDPKAVEAAKADLKFNLRMVEGVVSKGGDVSQEQFKMLQSARERLAKATGTLESVEREAALGILKTATEAGVSTEEYLKTTKAIFGLNTTRIAAEIKRIQIQNEKGESDIAEDRERKAILGDMTPDEKREYLLGIGRVYDPLMGKTYQAPRPQGSGRDIYGEGVLKDAAENRGVQALLANDYTKTPSVPVADPALVILLRQLGMNVDVNSPFTARERADLLNRLTSRPGASDRSPAGGVQFGGSADPGRVSALAEARRRHPELAQKSDDEVWQLILNASQRR